MKTQTMKPMLLLAFACIVAIASVSVQAASPPERESAPPQIPEKYIVEEAPVAPVSLTLAVLIHEPATMDALSVELLKVAADRELTAEQALDLEIAVAARDDGEHTPGVARLCWVEGRWERWGECDQWGSLRERGDPGHWVRTS